MSLNNPSIALIDDDIEIRELLEKYLNKQNLNVSSFEDGESFLDSQYDQFDACILDIGLPGIDGLQVCQKIRIDSNLPIIMLTAASDDLDRILGLELGADDYMGKPFNPRELLARIKALLRRAEVKIQQTEESECKLKIDQTLRHVFFGDSQLDLTGAEFDLLQILSAQPGQVLSRDQIGQKLYGRKLQPFDRSIDTIISRLRKKLSEFTTNDCIQSVRGKGYILTLHL